MDIDNILVGFDKKIKNILRTPKRGGKKDWDFDGVSNKKDCQPRNTMRQDKISSKDAGVKDNEVLGWTHTGSLVAVLSTDNYRSHGYFVFGKPNSIGKRVSLKTAKQTPFMTQFGKKWLSNPNVW